MIEEMFVAFCIFPTVVCGIFDLIATVNYNNKILYVCIYLGVCTLYLMFHARVRKIEKVHVLLAFTVIYGKISETVADRDKEELKRKSSSVM